MQQKNTPRYTPIRAPTYTNNQKKREAPGGATPKATQAKEDKARYDAALKAAGVLTKAEKKAQGPKRPLSAYMHFCAERRPSLTEELKAQLGAEFKYTLVMTKLGEEWRGVGDKSKYEAMAAADKASKAA